MFSSKFPRNEEREKRPNEGVEYYVAIDLGQVTQVSGLALVETADKGQTCLVRQLRRYPAGVGYPEIARSVADLVSRPPVARTEAESDYRTKPHLIVGVTAVGLSVGDLFAGAPAAVRPVMITAGDQVLEANGVARWPKRELIGLLQRRLQEKQLTVSKKLPDSGSLLEEMQGYTTRVRLGAEGDDWRREGGRLDDLVLAVALACFAAHNRPPDFEFYVSGPDDDGWVGP